MSAGRSTVSSWSSTMPRSIAPLMAPAGLLQSAADPYAAVSVRATAYLPEVTALTADVVASCRSHGLRVITWTVRTEEEARQALRVGVDGIIADDPTLIRKMLARLKTSP